jgi:hypothetical protein
LEERVRKAGKEMEMQVKDFAAREQELIKACKFREETQQSL